MERHRLVICVFSPYQRYSFAVPYSSWINQTAWWKGSSTLPGSVGQVFFSSVSEASFTRQWKRSFLRQTPRLMAMLQQHGGQGITTSRGIAFSLGSAYLSPSGGDTTTVPGTGSVLENQTNQEVSQVEQLPWWKPGKGVRNQKVLIVLVFFGWKMSVSTGFIWSYSYYHGKLDYL